MLWVELEVVTLPTLGALWDQISQIFTDLGLLQMASSEQAGCSLKGQTMTLFGLWTTYSLYRASLSFLFVFVFTAL